VATLADLAGGAPKLLTDPERTEEATARPVWAWLGRIAKDGFTAAPDLVKATGDQPSGIRAHTPTVLLGAPLDGWLVDAVEAKGSVTWRLVTPDNRTATPLATLPYAPAECEAEDRADGLCADYTFPSTLQVVLTPDRTQLLLTVSLGDGTHCGSDRVSHLLAALPAGALPTP